MNYLVITGGGGGLGNAIVQAFTSSDWEIFAPDRSALDVTDLEKVESLRFRESVDLLVCAAGITRDAPLSRTDESVWDEVLGVNYQAAAACAAAVLPGMIERGRGHIVFISSYSAYHPPRGQVAYATAKAALLGLTTGLARENGHHGIRINAILPGFLETRMTETVSDQRKKEVLSDHTLGHFNRPAIVGKFIRYLHEELPETSGQVFQLDSRIS